MPVSRTIVEATKRQPHSLADEQKAQAARANNPAFAAEMNRDAMALVEETRMERDADYKAECEPLPCYVDAYCTVLYFLT